MTFARWSFCKSTCRETKGRKQKKAKRKAFIPFVLLYHKVLRGRLDYRPRVPDMLRSTVWDKESNPQKAFSEVPLNDYSSESGDGPDVRVTNNGAIGIPAGGAGGKKFKTPVILSLDSIILH